MKNASIVLLFLSTLYFGIAAFSMQNKLDAMRRESADNASHAIDYYNDWKTCEQSLYVPEGK